MNYYNEWDAYRAEWLRNLIRDRLIPDGEVDERDIEELQAEDLEGFTQCHWFAGISGWPLALQLAGWLPDVPAWTGSCPCQPLSCAGKREGEKDARHLWPVFYRLICQRRPPVVFGEQTASGDGPKWVAGVRLDLEAAGYRVGIANLPVAGVGAPHIRHRIWWVADATGERANQCRQAESSSDRADNRISRADSETAARVVHASGGELAGRSVESAREERPAAPRSSRSVSGLGDASHQDGWADRCRQAQGTGSGRAESTGAGFWSDYEVLYRNEPKRGLVPCRAEPGVFPLVDGFPTRVEQVSAYGDAICPQTAAEFVKAFMQIGG